MNYIQLSTGLIFRTELEYNFTSNGICQPYTQSFGEEKKYKNKMYGQLYNPIKDSWSNTSDFTPRSSAIVAEWKD